MPRIWAPTPQKKGPPPKPSRRGPSVDIFKRFGKTIVVAPEDLVDSSARRGGRAGTSSPSARPHFAFGPTAAGTEILKRGVFKVGASPEARGQQRRLSAAALEAGKEIQRQQQLDKAKAKVNRLLSQGKTRQAGKTYRESGLGAQQAKGLTGIVARTGQDITGSILTAPFGVAEASKGLYLDSKDMRTHHDFSMKRTRALGEAMVRQTYEDVRHPLRHPGYTAMDALAVASLGAGAVTRGLAATEAANVAARTTDITGLALRRRMFKAALTRPSSKGGSLLHTPAAGEIPLSLPHPTEGRQVIAHALQPRNPLLRPIHAWKTAQVQRHLDDLGAEMKAHDLIRRRDTPSLLDNPKALEQHLAKHPWLRPLVEGAPAEEGAAAAERTPLASLRATVGSEGAAKREIGAFLRQNPEMKKRYKEILPEGYMPKGPSAASKYEQKARLFNRPFRIFGVYLNPRYIVTNLAGNVSMGAMHQGPLNIARTMGRARMLHRTVGPELANWIEKESGTSRSQAMIPETSGPSAFERSYGGYRQAIKQKGVWGKAKALTGEATQTVMRTTDRDFRVANWLYEAEQKGYHTAADFERLKASSEHPALSNTKLNLDRTAIARRSNKASVDFDSLTPAEKRAVEIVYFYPWLSRSAAWTARHAVNRPGQTAALMQASRASQPEYQRLMGNIPRWMRGYIPTKAGLLNPNSIFTPSTVATTALQVHQLARASAGLPTALQNPGVFGEVGTPALQALSGGSIPQMIGQTGPLLLAKRYGILKPSTPYLGYFAKPSKTFPETGAKAAFGPWFAGGFFPRKADFQQVRKQYERQVIGEASPTQRPGVELRLKQDKLYDEIKLIKKTFGHRPTQNLIGGYRGDLVAKAKQDEFIAQFAKKKGVKSYRSLAPVDKLQVAIDYAKKYGHHTPEQIKHFEDIHKNAKSDYVLNANASGLWAQTGVGYKIAAWDSIVRAAKQRQKTPAGKNY